MKQITDVETLSELLEMAVEDMKIIKQNPDYEVNMDVWHEQAYDEKCSVCMAGAVIARRLVPDNIEAICEPSDFPYDIAQRLHIINDIRVGKSLLRTVNTFGFTHDDFKTLRDMLDCDIDLRRLSNGDLRTWKGLISRLKKKGL